MSSAVPASGLSSPYAQANQVAPLLGMLLNLVVMFLQMQLRLGMLNGSGLPSQGPFAASGTPQTDSRAASNPLTMQTNAMAIMGRNQVLRGNQGAADQQAESSSTAPGNTAPASTTPAGTGGASGIMDLSPFHLMLPIGQQGRPDIIPGHKLNNYQSQYFQRRSDGAITFFAPVTGVHSANSEDPRSELGQTQNWKMTSGRHTLSASLTLDKVPSSGEVTIGQVHQRNNNSGPPIMITWKNGQVIASVKEANSPSAKRKHYVLAENVPKDQKIDYTVDVAPDGLVEIDLNGKKTEFTLNPDSGFKDADMYFKAGLYVHDNQGNSSEGARATFTRLQMT